MNKSKWLPGKNSGVTINAAWIGVAGFLIVSLCGHFFSKPNNAVKDGQLLFQGSGGTAIVNNYYNNDNATKDAIQEFDKKVSSANEKSELTKKELSLLSKALKDLDERTSAIKKIPDGRTQFGGMTSGQPSVVIENFNSSAKAFDAKEFELAYRHIKVAIKAFEDSQSSSAGIQIGGYSPEGIGQLYRLAGIVTQSLKLNDEADLYAQKAVQEQPNFASNHALRATTLFNLNKVMLAQEEIERALVMEPNNKNFEKIKNEILQKL